MSVRNDFAELLETDWADIEELAGFRVVATERELDDIREPTALLRMKGYKYFPEAPASSRVASMWLTIISPRQDLDEAADELEEAVPLVLDYLDIRCRHEDAELASYNDRLAYNIPFSLIVNKN